ncbi:Sorting nexin-24 [Dissostichus eleginoides]|uniref:Sorting nexin-24 n=1 Tax=Dissostichus eleginoides TaxID=100907 RepID=A0AAD9EWZ4_DISEL|nr:Sorting nexin-24 [Dissostichus eleginoides]
MHPVRVSIPSFRSENNSIEKGYTVFRIDVLMNGRQHAVEKRYSEFHTLHKMLKKSIKPPEMPSKHVETGFLKSWSSGGSVWSSTCRSFDTESEESSKLSHQPVLLFLRDPYLLPSAHDAFSNVVIEGVVHGVFYPDLQPR